MKLPFLSLLIAGGSVIAAAQTASGQGQFVRTVGDVKLGISGGALVPVRPGLAVTERSVIRTGADSRAEVRYARGEVLRPGSNTAVSVQNSGQFLDLRQGVVLVSVPPGAPAVQVVTGNFLTKVGSGTLIFEHQPQQFVKTMVLEGRPQIMLRSRTGEASTLKPGHMVIAPPQGPLAPPVDFDISVVLRSSLLLKSFAPLPTRNSILQQVARQSSARRGGSLIDTNLVIYGTGTAVTLTTPVPSRQKPAKKRSSGVLPSPSPRP